MLYQKQEAVMLPPAAIDKKGVFNGLYDRYSFTGTSINWLLSIKP
jgi:hypothetical protein